MNHNCWQGKQFYAIDPREMSIKWIMRISGFNISNISNTLSQTYPKIIPGQQIWQPPTEPCRIFRLNLCIILLTRHLDNWSHCYWYLNSFTKIRIRKPFTNSVLRQLTILLFKQISIALSVLKKKPLGFFLGRFFQGTMRVSRKILNLATNMHERSEMTGTCLTVWCENRW